MDSSIPIPIPIRLVVVLSRHDIDGIPNISAQQLLRKARRGVLAVRLPEVRQLRGRRCYYRLHLRNFVGFGAVEEAEGAAGSGLGLRGAGVGGGG